MLPQLTRGWSAGRGTGVEDEKPELPSHRQTPLDAYGQPPQGPYGYPPYGYPPYGYGYPQPPRGTNGLAIAALVLGICGFLVATPIIGLIFGIVSLSAVRKTGQKGKGMAISGIVLSGAWIAIFATFITIGVVTRPDPARRDANGTVVSPGSVSVFALHKKDCFTLPHGVIGSTHAKTSTVKVVPCATAHDSESIGAFTVAEAPARSRRPAHREHQAVRPAAQRLHPGLGVAASGSRMEYLYPDQRAWDDGQRQVMCFVQFPAATMTQSVCRDPSSYTADQMLFLNAYDPLSEAIGALSETSKTADISVLRQRAADIVHAEADEEAGLKAEQWSPDVQPAVDALIANHDAAARVWAQVEGSSDTATFYDGARRAYDAFSVQDLVAVRDALGLTTTSGGGTSPGGLIRLSERQPEPTRAAEGDSGSWSRLRYPKATQAAGADSGDGCHSR